MEWDSLLAPVFLVTDAVAVECVNFRVGQCMMCIAIKRMLSFDTSLEETSNFS